MNGYNFSCNRKKFLPAFISEKLTASDIEELNSMKEKLYLHYGGRNKMNNSWIIKILSESQKVDYEKKNNF